MGQELNSCIGDKKMIRPGHAIVHRSKFLSSMKANYFQRNSVNF